MQIIEVEQQEAPVVRQLKVISSTPAWADSPSLVAFMQPLINLMLSTASIRSARPRGSP